MVFGRLAEMTDASLPKSGKRGAYKKRSQRPMRLHKEQYQIIASRRQTYDTMLWQTPTLAILAQAFLLTIALNSTANTLAKIIVSLFALFVGLAALHLLYTLRYFEKYDVQLLRIFEESEVGYAVVHGDRTPLPDVPEGWLWGIKSFCLWKAILVGFLLLDAFAILNAACNSN
jgi:hypothetical protein